MLVLASLSLSPVTPWPRQSCLRQSWFQLRQVQPSRPLGVFRTVLSCSFTPVVVSNPPSLEVAFPVLVNSANELPQPLVRFRLLLPSPVPSLCRQNRHIRLPDTSLSIPLWVSFGVLPVSALLIPPP